MKSLCGFLSFGHTIFLAASTSFLTASTGTAQIPGPSAEHAKWKPYVGKWSFELTDSENQVSKGTNETVEACGGMWFVTTMDTNMAGMPFQGKGLDGYDPVKKKYISVWVDSFTASPMIFEGEHDKAGKVLTMICEGKDPMTGGPRNMEVYLRIRVPGRIQIRNVCKTEGWQRANDDDRYLQTNEIICNCPGLGGM